MTPLLCGADMSATRTRTDLHRLSRARLGPPSLRRERPLRPARQSGRPGHPGVRRRARGPAPGRDGAGARGRGVGVRHAGQRIDAAGAGGIRRGGHRGAVLGRRRNAADRGDRRAARVRPGGVGWPVRVVRPGVARARRRAVRVGTGGGAGDGAALARALRHRDVCRDRQPRRPRESRLLPRRLLLGRALCVHRSVGPGAAGDAAFWNAPFGAVRTRSDIRAASGEAAVAAAAFIREGMARVDKGDA